jgi:hypothetical protein
MPAVTVNLNVNVDANGNIEVFGAGPDVSGNIVVAERVLPVNALYDGTKNGTNGAGLIEFWEPAADLGNIYAKLAYSSQFNIKNNASYRETAKAMAYYLQFILCDRLDAKDASPFNASKYAGNTNYTTNPHFGRLALSAYSHYLFGHVDATAAITNDADFMASMLSVSNPDMLNENVNPYQRVIDWTKDYMVYNTNVEDWDASQSSADANLAVALTKAIINKGFTAHLSATRDTAAAAAAGAVVGADTIANIVKQVIGQDASRAMDKDNNEIAPEVHQILRFEVGDTIFMSITLDAPTVSVTDAAQLGAPATSKYDKDLSTTGIQKEKYDIKITIGPYMMY